MATTLTQYGITWTWSEDREIGTFANGDYWVVGPITLTGITPGTAVSSGRRINGSMINPAPGNYTGQGFDTSILGYNDALNIALVGGDPLSISNTRSVVAGSSICTVISTAEPDRAIVRQAFSDFAVLTVLASAPVTTGWFRPPYTGTDKTLSWNKSQLDYSILRNLTPVAGMSAPSPRYFARPWVEIEMSYNEARFWHPINNQPEYDRDMGFEVSQVLLELQQNYSNAAKEAAYVGIVQYGIDVYGQVKNSVWNINGTDYPGIQDNSQTKPALVMAALALDDADMKSYVDGPEFQPNPYAWSELGIPRFYADNQLFYVTQEDVGRALNPGNQQYVQGDVGKAEWGSEHWSNRSSDSAAWGKAYRDVRYKGQVGQALAMRLIGGALALWNNQVYFDYYDRAFGIYTGGTVDDPTPTYVRLFWEAYRGLAAPQPVLTVSNAGSSRATYSLDSPRTVSLAGLAESIYYTLDGGADILYTSPFVVSTNTVVEYWGVMPATPDSAIGTATITFVTAGHPCAPANLAVV